MIYLMKYLIIGLLYYLIVIQRKPIKISRSSIDENGFYKFKTCQSVVTIKF